MIIPEEIVVKGEIQQQQQKKNKKQLLFRSIVENIPRILILALGIDFKFQSLILCQFRAIIKVKIESMTIQ
jgi:hypothetical protein